MRNRARRRWAWLALAGSMVVVLGGLAWLARSRPVPDPASPATDVVPTACVGRHASPTLAIDPLAPVAAGGPASSPQREAVEHASIRPAGPVRVKPPGRELVAQFVSPDNGALVVNTATVDLVDDAGSLRRAVAARGASS